MVKGMMGRYWFGIEAFSGVQAFWDGAKTTFWFYSWALPAARALLLKEYCDIYVYGTAHMGYGWHRVEPGNRWESIHDWEHINQALEEKDEEEDISSYKGHLNTNCLSSIGDAIMLTG
jgi:hypothetical protein